MSLTEHKTEKTFRFSLVLLQVRMKLDQALREVAFSEFGSLGKLCGADYKAQSVAW